MANRIKKNNNFDASRVKAENQINTGNWDIGLNADGDGPTEMFDFYNGILLDKDAKFAIYSDSNDPEINLRVAKDPESVISLLEVMGFEQDSSQMVATGSKVGQYLAWAKVSDILILNNAIDLTNTNRLVTFLDARHVTSYPQGGRVWYSLHDSKSMQQLKVLGFRQHSSAAPIFSFFEKYCEMLELESIDQLYEMQVEEINAEFDLVVVDSYVWSFNNTTMTTLKNLVDAGVSCICAGNDNRKNIFVKDYDSSLRSSHNIQMEADSKIGLSNETFTYGSGDVYGGIVTLQNGAVPVYRRADNNLITGFVYDNYNTGASLFFDQEGISSTNTEILQAGVEYVLKHIGSKANFINTPSFNVDIKAFEFNADSTWFDLSNTAVEELSGDYTLSGFCKQAETGAPHQTLIGTASNYRSGGKLMSRYHGPASFWVGNSDGTDSYVLSSNEDITGRGWHHLAATRRSSDGLVQIYVDGELKNEVKLAEVSSKFTGTMSMGGSSAVGMDYHSSSYRHYGSIQSAKAWAKVLSEDEILQEYYGAKISVNEKAPTIFMDPANLKTYDVENVNQVEQNPASISEVKDLQTGKEFTIERDGLKVPGAYIDEHNGILRLNSSKIYTENIGWFGKMSISWWMKSNSPEESGTFYTESYRQSGGCSRISSTILGDGRFNFSVWDNSSYSADFGGSHNVVSQSSVMDGEWHQVTCQWSNGTGNLDHGIYVYIDGQLENANLIPLGDDGSYQHLHLGGVTGCVGNKGFNVDFGPIIHYKNHNLTHEQVYQNYAAHANRYR